MSDDSSRVCRRVKYRGRVQGVGFRWTTARVARRFPIEGYVRNLADGTVELVVQGPTRDVSRFLDEVAKVMAGNVESADVTEESVQADLSGFSIRP